MNVTSGDGIFSAAAAGHGQGHVPEAGARLAKRIVLGTDKELTFGDVVDGMDSQLLTFLLCPLTLFPSRTAAISRVTRPLGRWKDSGFVESVFSGLLFALGVREGFICHHSSVCF